MRRTLRCMAVLALTLVFLSACGPGGDQSLETSVKTVSSLPHTNDGLNEGEQELFERLAEHWDSGKEMHILFVSDAREALAKGRENLHVDGKELVFDSLFAYRDKEPMNNGYYIVFVEKES